MARPKKDAVPFNIKADRKVMERFEAYCEEVGQTKTLAWERIVTEYLDQYYADKRKEEGRK